MPRIAVAQETGLQVKHTDEQRDEHVQVVVLGQRLVKCLHDEAGLHLTGRHVAEQRARHCHEQRGGDSLARHVADAEDELLVVDVEVEQVATHRLGRHQRPEDVDVVAVGVGREGLGKHRHLDVVRYLQLALEGGLLCRRALELLHVSGQRVLHLLERVAQQVYLVTACQRGQRRAEVTLGHLVG